MNIVRYSLGIRRFNGKKQQNLTVCISKLCTYCKHYMNIQWNLIKTFSICCQSALNNVSESKNDGKNTTDSRKRLWLGKWMTSERHIIVLFLSNFLPIVNSINFTIKSISFGVNLKSGDIQKRFHPYEVDFEQTVLKIIICQPINRMHCYFIDPSKFPFTNVHTIHGSICWPICICYFHSSAISFEIPRRKQK